MSGQKKSSRVGLGIGIRSVVASLLASALLSPFVATGCTAKKACVQWGADRGACPSRDSALAIMPSGCSDVASVDSDAEVEDDLCCYEISEVDSSGIICATTPPSPGITVGPGPGPGPSVASVTTGPPACGGFVGGECAPCAESFCCDWIAACFDTGGCVDCVADPSTCSFSPSGAEFADALFQCLWSSCSDTCFSATQRQAACDAFLPGGSDGACFTVDNQTSFCNPVKADDCGDIGVCDVGTNALFECVPKPISSAGPCKPCGASGFCDPGYACVDGLCARYCCDDSDCGSGHCDQTLPDAAPDAAIGLCMQGGGGQGGTGGVGGAGGGAGGAGGS